MLYLLLNCLLCFDFLEFCLSSDIVHKYQRDVGLVTAIGARVLLIVGILDLAHDTTKDAPHGSSHARNKKK